MATRHQQSARAIVLWAGVSLLTVGCATLTPEQQIKAQAVRAMVDEAARVYNVPRLYVLVGPDIQGRGGTYRPGMLTITTRMLGSKFLDSVVAHELAHYLLGHEGPRRGPTEFDRQREQEQRELDANAKAVEILQRVKGMSEGAALRFVYEHLLSFHRAVTQKKTVVPWGHRLPCEEIADLLGRFPAQATWTGTLECASSPPARSRIGGSEASAETSNCSSARIGAVSRPSSPLWPAPARAQAAGRDLPALRSGRGGLVTYSATPPPAP